jgi:hypothetical protein
MENDRELLKKQIDSLNDEIKTLAYKLGGLLDVDCNLGVCSYNPEADNLQETMKEVQKRKTLLEKIMKGIDSCDLGEAPGRK